MTRIAFIGLGIMGLPMATNLVRAGHEVTARAQGLGDRDHSALLLVLARLAGRTD